MAYQRTVHLVVQVYEGKFGERGVAIKKVRREHAPARKNSPTNAKRIEEDKNTSNSLERVVKATYLATIASPNICKLFAVRWTKDELWCVRCLLLLMAARLCTAKQALRKLACQESFRDQHFLHFFEKR